MEVLAWAAPCSVFAISSLLARRPPSPCVSARLRHAGSAGWLTAPAPGLSRWSARLGAEERGADDFHCIPKAAACSSEQSSTRLFPPPPLPPAACLSPLACRRFRHTIMHVHSSINLPPVCPMLQARPPARTSRGRAAATAAAGCRQRPGQQPGLAACLCNPGSHGAYLSTHWRSVCAGLDWSGG